uniref:Peptidase A2 domain-containing protein n=1 Tax=Alexandrium catenella TaxID=2925 RepID=A0A7S1R2B3_ALECA
MGKKAGKNGGAGGRGGKAGASKAGGGAEDDDALLDAALEAVTAECNKAAELSKAGEESMASNDWAQAVKHFTEAIAADPNNGVHHARRSAAHLSAGHMDDGLADAKVSASLGGTTSAESADCHSQLGHALFAGGQLQAALESYNRGLKLCPEHAGCRQGCEEVAVALERHGGKRPPPSLGPGDIDAQELRTLPAPEEVLGKGFEVVHLMVGTFDKPLTFLLSTTLTVEATISPNTCGMLGMPIKRTVDLTDVRLEGGHALGTLEGCTVSGFVQAQIAEKALHTRLHGILGLPFLSRFDIQFDRLRQEQRFKEPGVVAKAEGKPPCPIHLHGTQLPGGLLGVPVQVRGKRKGAAATNVVLGLVDTGSMFSVISWQAAKDLGIAEGPGDAAFGNSTKVAGPTKDGVAEMPLVNVKVSICTSPAGVGCRLGGLTKEELAEGRGQGWRLDFAGKDCKPCAEFGRINAAIGDAIQFELLRDSAVGEFIGGAVLIGQDVLAQAPKLVLSAKDRQVWLDAPSRVIDASPL